MVTSLAASVFVIVSREARSGFLKMKTSLWEDEYMKNFKSMFLSFLTELLFKMIASMP